MRNTMNLVVLGEGPDEMGADWSRRHPLVEVAEHELGALEILVRRVMAEIHSTAIVCLGLPRLRRDTIATPPSTMEVLTNLNLLERLLIAAFLAPSPARRAEGALIVCDSDHGCKVQRVVGKVRSRVALYGKVVLVIVRPEFEALLLDKAAVEKATGSRRCSKGPSPDPSCFVRGGLKEAFQQWAGIRDAAKYAEIAQQVNVKSTNLAVADFRTTLRELL
ncbi:MAG: hypothetical protein HY683_06165 [Chloroflexi bacterium]|nr:hypothetical protein [Chloroflexota bacterium]